MGQSPWKSMYLGMNLNAVQKFWPVKFISMPQFPRRVGHNGPMKTSPNSDPKIAENGTRTWPDIAMEGAKLFHDHYYCPKKVMLA